LSAWLPVALSVLGGWGIGRWHRRLPGAPGAVSGTVLWGIALMGTSLVVLDAAGIRWTQTLLALPASIAAAAGFFAQPTVEPSSRRERTWGAVAAAAVAARALVVAVVPSFGWDFRYSWGLKAKVFALAGRHDFAWLTRPPDWLAHPDYPPLWSDLIATGVIFGGDPGTTAAAWQALFVVGIAAACWECSAPAPAPVRALAATVGAWIPVVFTPTVAYSGYAEPLIAFGINMGVASLPRMALKHRGAWITTAGACAILAMTKNEGAALATALAIAAWRTSPRRAALAVAAATLGSVACWRVAATLHGVQGYVSVLSPAWVGNRLLHLPGEAWSVATPTLVALLVAWVAALAAVRGSDAPAIWIVVGVWAVALLAAYLTSPLKLDHMLRFSLDRELAVPLPIMVAAGLRDVRFPSAAAPSGPDSAPAG
jgi:hypothetical protein